MTGPTLTAGTVPVGPMLSMFDPIYVGIDEFGHPVYIRIIYKNLLAAGEPGGGKSGLMNTLTAHAALSARPGWCCSTASKSNSACGTTSPTNSSAPTSTTPSSPCAGSSASWTTGTPGCAPTAAARSARATASPSSPRSSTRSPCTPPCWAPSPSKRNSSPCSATWWPAAAPPPCPSSPPPSGPSVDIIPKSLRDLFGYRAAFRCTSTGSSDIILGDGLSAAGFTATDIAPSNPGECLLIAEGGIPAADQGLLPVRRRHHRPGRLRRLDPPHQRLPPHRRPGHRRRLNRPPGKEPS